MRIFFTEEQIAKSKADWEPQLRAFANSTNAALQNARRLPIYDHAVPLATKWLELAIHHRLHLQPHETLIVAGDEHLHHAFNNTPVPNGSLFLYHQAWKHWWSTVFRGEAPWWQDISWAINCHDRIIDLAHPHNHNLKLIPNQTYLCTEEVANRGTHTILQMVDNKLTLVETFAEWVDSV